MMKHDLESTILLLLDGTLPDEEIEELEERLLNDPAARTEYARIVRLHSALEARFAARTATRSAGVVPVDRVVTIQRRRVFKYSLLGAAALLVLMGVVLKLVLVPEPKPLLSFRAAPDSVLSVTHFTTDREGKEPEPGTLAKGSRLELTQGTVEFTLSTGVVSIVRAPADLTLHHKDQLYLNEGVAWFRVPKDAIGFKVATPQMVVTDLGTEFGVISTHGALDEVHLFEGKVEVRNHHGLKKSELLSGATARIAGPAGRLKSTPVRPDEFLTSLPSGLPHVHFAFEAIDNGQLTVEGTHPDVPDISARLVRPAGSTSAAPLVSGKHGRALQLSGRGDFVLTDWPGISGKRARTVACWIRMPEGGRYNPANAIVGWGSLQNNGKWKIHAVPGAKGQGRVPRISLGGATWYFTEKTRLDDRQWHHLVAVSYGRTLKDGRPDLVIFVDGQRQALTPHDEGTRRDRSREVNTITDARDSVPVLVGKGVPSQKQSFRGTIDELTIYEGALTDESIRQLAAGKPLNEDQ